MLLLRILPFHQQYHLQIVISENIRLYYTFTVEEDVSTQLNVDNDAGLPRAASILPTSAAMTDDMRFDGPPIMKPATEHKMVTKVYEVVCSRNMKIGGALSSKNTNIVGDRFEKQSDTHPHTKLPAICPTL